MYVKRVQIMNYGPIEALDIEFPFDGDKPKPVVLVGTNGSGKSILLSNIVNGLLSAQARAYPDSPEVELGRVYKLRSPQYVRWGKEYSFMQVDFADLPPLQELILPCLKRDFEFKQMLPVGIKGTDAESLYNKLNSKSNSIFNHDVNPEKARYLLQETCALYFPPNRFEDPAWLNNDNLTATAQYMYLKHLEGYSDRKIVNISPLRTNQDWLFNVIYDFIMYPHEEASRDWFDLVCEIEEEACLITKNKTRSSIIHLSPGIDFTRNTRKLYNAATEVIRAALRHKRELALSIGHRYCRVVSVIIDKIIRIPNIFHLSAGEVSLLNLFLSILRDYDLTAYPFASAEEIRGIVIVDEIDLHLHTVHQHEVLPKLMAMFPKIQFIVTSHSPLFVLGLKREFGEEGFGLYELPSGVQISAEEFKEFGEAYQAFSKTRQHSKELQNAIKNAQKPLVFVEGTIDVKYLQKAAVLWGFQDLMEAAEIRDGGGSSLRNIWQGLTRDHVEREQIVVLYDPEFTRNETKGNMFLRSMTKCADHPIQKGIENLFDHETLERARRERPAFIDVTGEHRDMVRGEEKVIPETWDVNKDEKTNLCHWLCENGTANDFEHFRPTLQMLRNLLVKDTPEAAS